MKRSLLLSTLMLPALGAMAQLPANSWAPDFTATDINGESHHLYEYLDQGYTVIMDISAAWCNPCWQYHNSGALENLYNTYGPGTAENKVMVLFIEGQGSNTVDQINGTSNPSNACASSNPTIYYGGCTQGNWTTGTPYPIIDNAQIADAYAINYFPTIYKICPNRIVNEVGQLNTAQLWASVQECPVATTGLNAGLAFYTGDRIICDEVHATVTLQNMGSDDLTAATVELKEGGTVIGTQNWSGDLATYGTAEITFPAASVTDPADVTVEVTAAGDNNAADNVLDPGLIAATPAMANLTFALTLDWYCSETTWKLFNSSNAVVHQGGPYNCGSNGGGVDANQTKTYNWTLPLDCYRMEIYDEYGDGMMSSIYNPPHPDGHYDLMDGGANHVFSGTGDFGERASGGINVNAPASVRENSLDNSLNIYPNPTTGNVFLNYDLAAGARVTTEVYNALGERVLASTSTVPAGIQVKQLDLGGLTNGVYFLNITADGLKASRTITLNK